MKIEDMIRYAEVFAKHRENPIIKQIVSGQTSFVGELERFYNVTSQVDPPIVNYKLQKEQYHKIGTVPNDLINILQEFGLNSLSQNEIEYQYVRNNLQPPLTKDEKIGKRVLFGTVVVTALFTPSIYYLTHSTDTAAFVMIATSSLGTLISLSFLTTHSKQSGRKIFPLLFEAAEKADIFKKIEYPHRNYDYSFVLPWSSVKR